MTDQLASQEEQVRHLFNQKAEKWSDKYSGFFRFRVELFVSAIQKHVPVGARILDFGCGTGVYVEALATLGYELVGIDLSSAMLTHAQDRCRSQAADVQWHCGSLLELAPQLGTFDAILGSSVFEYLTDPERHLVALWNLLRPGGLLFLTVPNYDSRRKQRERQAQKWRPLLQLFAFIPKVAGFLQYLNVSRNHYQAPRFRQLAESHGFLVKEWQYFNPLTGACTTHDSAGGEMLFFILQRPLPNSSDNEAGYVRN